MAKETLKKVELLLSDGRKVEIHQGKGHHIIQASKLISSPEELQTTLVALLTTIDGQKVQIEEISDLIIPDYMMLMEAFLKLNPLFPQEKLSH